MQIANFINMDYLFNKHILIVLFAALSFASCQKERIIQVQTLTPEQNGSSYIARGVLVDMGEASEVKHGFLVGENPAPDMNDWDYNLYYRSETGEFSTELKHLEANSQYYIRSFVMDGSVIHYGNEVSFFTSDTSLQLTTGMPNIVDEQSILVDGTIENQGSLLVHEFGHCWANTESPTISDLHISHADSWGDTTFTNTITGLSLQTQYWVRTYCRLNDDNYLYGNSQKIFIPDLIVATDTVVINANQTATLQGEIVSLGINPVVSHGHLWSTTSAFPDYNSHQISLGEAYQEGVYYTTLYDLQPGVTYYYRAYASNGQYVKYGTVKTFTTN